MTDPDQLAQDLGQTRATLRNDVTRLSDRVSPARFVDSRTSRVKSGAAAIKDRLMGSGGSVGSAAADRVGSVQDATGAAAAKIGDAAGSAPDAARAQATGNPVAAGLIAFGAGWLISSLVPASSTERDAARTIEDNADGVVEPLTDSARQVADNLRAPAQHAADEVQQKATEAVQRTSRHAQTAADDVKDQAATAKNHVADGPPRT